MRLDGEQGNPLEPRRPRRYTQGLRGPQAVAETQAHQRREVHYQGTVQGVGFRYTVRRIAGRFAVDGYVRNLPDGRVLLVAEGPPQELDRFLEAVHTTMGRCIDDVHETVSQATGQLQQFEIRY